MVKVCTYQVGVLVRGKAVYNVVLFRGKLVYNVVPVRGRMLCDLLTVRGLGLVKSWVLN